VGADITKLGDIAEFRQSEATRRDDAQMGCRHENVAAKASGREVCGRVQYPCAAIGTWGLGDVLGIITTKSEHL